MYEAELVLKCTRPEIVAVSLKPDIKNDADTKTSISSTRQAVRINIKSRKLNHLKAIINSYLDLVQMLEGIDKI
jgi:tRNA threonylcarbamoyladenosine modification (KEOPS) complex  Pcc1 subunit